MSLKVFHIVFITLATLLSLGCGAGALRAYLEQPSGVMLVLTLVAFASATALLIYGAWFLKKAKQLIT